MDMVSPKFIINYFEGIEIDLDKLQKIQKPDFSKFT